MNIEEEIKIRQDGYDAFYANKNLGDNPYKEDSEEYDWWYIGWLDADIE